MLPSTLLEIWHITNSASSLETSYHESSNNLTSPTSKKLKTNSNKPHDIYHLWTSGQPPPNQKPGPWNPSPIACAAGDDDSKGCRASREVSASEEWEEVGASVAGMKFGWGKENLSQIPGDSYEKKQMLPEKNGGKLCLFHEWLDLFPPFFLSRIMGTCGYQVLWLAASSKQL